MHPSKPSLLFKTRARAGLGHHFPSLSTVLVYHTALRLKDVPSSARFRWCLDLFVPRTLLFGLASGNEGRPFISTTPFGYLRRIHLGFSQSSANPESVTITPASIHSTMFAGRMNSKNGCNFLRRRSEIGSRSQNWKSYGRRSTCPYADQPSSHTDNNRPPAPSAQQYSTPYAMLASQSKT